MAVRWWPVWRWSSHRALVGLDLPTVVDVATTLAHFAADGGDGRARYAPFVGVPVPVPACAARSGEPLCPPPRPLDEVLNGPDDADAIAEAYFAEGYAVDEIAEALGVALGTIRNRLRSDGVK